MTANILKINTRYVLMFSYFYLIKKNIHFMKRKILAVLLLSIAFQGFTQVSASQFNLGKFHFRSLGPYRTGSWISEIAVRHR